MGTSFSVDQFVGKTLKVQKAVSDKSLNGAAFKRIGETLAPLATAAVRSTKLGSDAAFTAGSKGRANKWFNVTLEAHSNVHKDGMGLTMSRTKETAGPWRVAESGRGNNIGPVMPKVLKSGKLSKAKQHKRSARANGQTQGFDAWSKAESAMFAAAPPKVITHFTKAVWEVFR